MFLGHTISSTYDPPVCLLREVDKFDVFNRGSITLLKRLSNNSSSIFLSILINSKVTQRITGEKCDINVPGAVLVC